MAFGPFSAVPRDGETVRFVAHTLDQMQRTGVRRQYSRGFLAQQEQLLLTRSSIDPLCDADQGDALDTKLLQHPGRLRQLPLAAIDQ